MFTNKRRDKGLMIEEDPNSSRMAFLVDQIKPRLRKKFGTLELNINKTSMQNSL